MSIFKELKAEDPSYELIMIGGLDNSENDLYEEVKKANVINFGRIEIDQLPLYYSASDVFILYFEDQRLIKYGGLGTAPIEAMACNVPVISRQLIHYPGNDVEKIGEIPQDWNDLKDQITKVINNKHKNEPRKTAAKYYDFDLMLNRNIKEYSKIYKKYYE